MTVLGIQGQQFTINGRVRFLQGVSYYGALGAPEEFIKQDLAELRKLGFNWIRVWANWAAFENDVSVVDAEGNPREQFLKKLKWLVWECDRRNIVVDITLSRGNGVTGPPRLQTLEAHLRAVQVISAELKPFRNWYFDLANERNVKDVRHVSMDDLKELRMAVRLIDPRRLVTASHSGDLSSDELRDYLMKVRLDFVSPHRRRDPDSSRQAESETRALIERIQQVGRAVPVHYQEPFRRGYAKWQPAAEDFLADARAAKAGGAAGWCFHNGDERQAPGGHPRRCFDLREKRLLDQLDEEERKALDLLSKGF